MSLRERLSNYFFGTERAAVLKRRKWFYGEHAREEEKDEYLREIRQRDFIDIGIGKKLPNIIDAASIAIALASNQPHFLMGIALAESLRFGFYSSPNKGEACFNYNRKNIMIGSEIDNISEYRKNISDFDEEDE